MKELTEKEKASRYDEVIDVINKCKTDKYGCIIGVKPTDIFPELKESEDERIRKELIFYLGDMPEDTVLRNGVTNRDVLVWLEKKGEQKISFSLPTEGEFPYNNPADTLDGEIENIWEKLSCDNKFTATKDGFHEVVVHFVNWLEKKGEQKPADNRLIPQKGEYYLCIKDYYSADGKTTNTKGKVYKSPCDGYINDDRGFGLSWTNSCTENHFRQVKPVKEEDWIVCEQKNVIGKPFQCKEFMSELIQKNIKSIEDKGIVPNFRLWNIFDAKDGDILFAKGSYFKEYAFIYSGMTEDNVLSTYCGFDIAHNNFDTKLTRFGRVEDFEIVCPATQEQRDLLFQKMKEAGYEWDAEKKELKKINQKSAWSKKDDRILDGIIEEIEANKSSAPDYDIPVYDRFLSFLKSLKERVQSQSQWKPSEEQLDALETAVSSLQSTALESLYNKLNKL